MNMKMTYNKPELNEVKLAANQAIAACTKRAEGWQLWDKRANPWYNSKEEALAAQPDQASSTANKVCKVFYVANDWVVPEWNNSQQHAHAYFEDWNGNNKPDSDEMVTNNQQGNLSDVISPNGAVINS